MCLLGITHTNFIPNENDCSTELDPKSHVLLNTYKIWKSKNALGDSGTEIMHILEVAWYIYTLL